MTEPLLSPVQQRIVICALAVLLLAVSLVGLWLCRRLRRAYARLYRRQQEETEVLLAHPDHRVARAQSPRVPPPGGPADASAPRGSGQGEAVIRLPRDTSGKPDNLGSASTGVP